MNYLILTPDGVGSTYLQRALTVHLNSVGLNYYNIHELLNGIECINSCVIKNFDFGYTQSLTDIKLELEKNTASIVSRLSDYHVYSRLEQKLTSDTEADYEKFYEFCNEYHDRIFYCTRDPFEYALSWSIRKISKAYNVYNIDRRIQVHGQDQKFNIDLEYFNTKLNQYYTYEKWVSKYFPNAIKVNYDNLNYDTDSVIENLTNVKSNISERFGVTLDQYSKILYNISLKKQESYKESTDFEYKKIKKLQQYVQKLIEENKLVTGIPIKMNTLLEKQQKVTNFENSISIYNNWASINNYLLIDKNKIAEKIKREQEIYNRSLPLNSYSLLEINNSLLQQSKEKVRVE